MFKIALLLVSCVKVAENAEEHLSSCPIAPSFEQSCTGSGLYNGNLVLQSREDLNEFNATYSGVTGSLSLDVDWATIELPCLREADQIKLQRPTTCLSIPNLENVRTVLVESEGICWLDIGSSEVDESLTLREPQLTNLAGLNEARISELKIQRGESITDFSLDNGVDILVLDELEGVSDLANVNLPEVRAELSLDSLDIKTLNGVDLAAGTTLRLRSLDQLENLEGIPQDLHLLQLKDLQIDSLRGIGTVTYSLQLSYLPNLTDLTPVADWTHAPNVFIKALNLTVLTVNWISAADVVIASDNKHSVQSIQMPRLESCDTLILDNNDFLTTASFPNLQTAGDIELPHATGHFSFPELKSAGSLTIEYGTIEQGSPLSLELPELEFLSEVLIHDNVLEALELPKLSRTGSITIDGTSRLQSFSAPNLTDIEGKLTMRNLDVMTELDLGSVAQLDELSLDHCDALNDLSDLTQLRTIDGSLTLLENNGLKDVTGLHNIEAIQGSLTIESNPSLLRQDAEALVQAIGEENIGGTIVIVDYH